MPEVNSNNPPPIFPIVPAPVPVVTPVQQPVSRPEPEMQAEEQDMEQDMSEEDTGAEEPAAPRRQTADDGISDLLEGMDTDAEMEDVDDLFEVSDADIMGDEDGDLSDITEVKREDIMGKRPPKRRVSRPPPTQ